MAKIIGLSGAQGGGKSSLLTELEARGWFVDQFRVSRAVQAQLGWTSLSNVLKDPQTMMEFQNEVLAQKYRNDYELRGGTIAHFIFTERTFADICAYTTYWTWELHDQGKWDFNEASDFLGSYILKCLKAQEDCYDAVILLPFMQDQVTWVDDPNRANRKSVDQIYESVERFTQSARFLTQPKLTITAKSVGDRAAQVELFTNKL